MTIHISVYFLVYWVISATYEPVYIWLTLKKIQKDLSPLIVSMIKSNFKPIVQKYVLTFFGISLIIIVAVMASPFLFPISILNQIKEKVSKLTLK